MSCAKRYMGFTLALCAAFVGCSSGTDPKDTALWHCGSRPEGTCVCQRFPDNSDVFVTSEVPLCQDFSCCLYSPDEKTDFGTGACECLDVDNCQAEASSRPGAMVVPLCPPGATVPPARCAKQGENCRYDYLVGHDLDGCCSGTVCRQGADGVPLCQPATDDEVAFSAQCSKFARGTATQALEPVTTTLATSVGTLALPPVEFGFLTVGPVGCVTSLDVTLSSGLNCKFEVSARVSGNELTITRISGEFSACAGYTGGSGPLDGSFEATQPAGTMTYTGAACDGNLIFESYDVAGRFDFHLATSESPNHVTVSDQHFIVEGSVGGDQPMGQCAASQ
jgi:hypothetical protein